MLNVIDSKFFTWSLTSLSLLLIYIYISFLDIYLFFLLIFKIEMLRVVEFSDIARSKIIFFEPGSNTWLHSSVNFSFLTRVKKLRKRR